MKKQVNILWTGGLDSTCRMVELSRFPYIIQPYYIMDPSRQSTKYEMSAMTGIRELLISDERTKSDIKPTIFVNIHDITKDDEITESRYRLHNRYGLGIQYEWLARYAKQSQIKLELGLQFSPTGRILKCIEENSKFLETKDHQYHVLMIDTDHSAKDVVNVFENFLFPASLYHKTKNEEVMMIRELMGNDEILKRTWFCHQPIFGLSCGHCHPCKDVIHEGMTWRISKIGYILGGCRKILIKMRSFVNVII